MKTPRTKMLTNESMLKNINGLSVGDRAYCGPYGIITCTKSAGETKSKTRQFKVANSSKLHNGGNWSMTRLRKAING